MDGVRVGGAASSGRPSGTVTFLFTDIEGSTSLWESASPAMAAALERHDLVLRAAIHAHAGHVFATGGDGFAAAFARASDAMAAATAAQAALAGERWPEGIELRVRMGLHTGEAVERDGNYFGPAVNQAARLMSLAHAGQVLCSATTASVVQGQVRVRDLGEHTLRGVRRPVQVFQVGVGQFPPLISADTPAGNVVLPLTSFVGRDQDLVRLARVVERSRLVTLVGVGGVGKTRLAVHAAVEAAGGFGDGVWLVELAAVEDPADVANVVASTLGVAQRTGLSVEDSVAEYLRARQTLLVLDNCEHVLDAAAALVESVLPSCPRVHMLATSREALAVEGEQLWPVRPLALPSSADDKDAASVRLFVERARAATPDFEPDAGALAAIVDICKRLDGMPLALELASSRVISMAPVELAALLDERFRLLTGGRRTAVERHQSLRAAVEWSHRLLSERDRQVFERLGVFVGSFDSAAASAVAADDVIDAWAVRDSVASLVSKSLVATVEGPEATTRYQLTETLRAYARECLDGSGEPDRWRRSHAKHYAGVGGRIAAGLAGPDELLWRARLDADLDNLRAAVGWSLESADDRLIAVTIVTDLGYVVANDEKLGIGRWAEQALPAADDAPPGRRATLRALAAYQRAQTGSPLAETRLLAEAAVAQGIPPGCPCPGVLYMPLALCESLQGRVVEAVDVLLEPLTESAGAESDFSAFDRFILHYTVAAFASSIDANHPTAVEHAELALEFARQTKSPSAIGMALSQIGWALVHTDADRAYEALLEAVAISGRGGRLGGYDHTLGALARLHVNRGDTAEAVQYVRAALAESHRHGNRFLLTALLKGIVPIAAHLGAFELVALLSGAIGATATSQVPASSALVPGGEAELDEARCRAREELGEDDYHRAERRGESLELGTVADLVLQTFAAQSSASP